MFKNLLVPFDGSDSSEKALDKAIELGKIFNSNICLISVAPEAKVMKHTPAVSDEDENLNEDVYDTTSEILEEAEIKLRDYPYTYNTSYLVGDPATEIINFSDENEVDLIVMGNRDLGVISRTLFGSVSADVIDKSNVSVLVVK